MTLQSRKISVIGLGYVGLPVAVAFAALGQTVIAFDIDEKRIAELVSGYDRTGEVASEVLKRALDSKSLVFSSDPAALARADFHIVTVPTPVLENHQPDLRPLIAASRTVGQHLKKGDIVVYESTVYPGATREDCVPVLETESGLQFATDFTVGYSPERINPGDQVHRFETITKVVAGSDPETLEIVAQVYESVVQAGVHRAASLEVAEAAKVIENTQRDVNIALMNELALIFDRLGIRTHDVLQAAGTKWNFLPFSPGLVGGHCIGVDPYYLTDRAESVGYHPEVILSGRRINDGMGAFVAQKVIKAMAGNSRALCETRVGVLGLTFKEDVPDLRNSKVPDILSELQAFGVRPLVHDPMADPEEARHEYGVSLSPIEAFGDLDALILAVPHRSYLTPDLGGFACALRPGAILADVKSVLTPGDWQEKARYWSL